MTATANQLFDEMNLARDAIKADQTDEAGDRLMGIFQRADALNLDGPTNAYTKLCAFLIQAEIAVGEESGLDFAGALNALQMLQPRPEACTIHQSADAKRN